MRVLLGFILVLSMSAPSIACELSAPQDIVECYELAFNSGDVAAMSRLLASEFTAAHVSPPSTPTTKSQEIEALTKMWKSPDVVSYELELGGSVNVVDLGSGRHRIDGITSELSLTTTRMDMGTPGSFVVKNWCVWYVRETQGGYEITKAEYWTTDPSSQGDR